VELEPTGTLVPAVPVPLKGLVLDLFIFLTLNDQINRIIITQLQQLLSLIRITNTTINKKYGMTKLCCLRGI
jgi:hypothetical protein